MLLQLALADIYSTIFRTQVNDTYGTCSNIFEQR
jgi:hypothetical protein